MWEPVIYSSYLQPHIRQLGTQWQH